MTGDPETELIINSVITSVLEIDDNYRFYYHDTLIPVGGIFHIPENGLKYWIIPFDPAFSPQRPFGGGDIEFFCNCNGSSGGTGCEVKEKTIDTDKYKYCNPTTCSDCCSGIVKEPAKPDVHGSFLLWPAQRLNYNWVIYE